MMNNLENVLEGLLFVAGDGIEKGFIMEKLGVTDKEITKAINKLKEKYSGECGINLMEYKNKIQLSSNPQYAEDISLVLNPIRERNLSKATLETVAIIAYKQPVTRLEVEEIRGVNSDYALQTLMNLKMIEVVGRKDAVGKPLLFGTTDEFLKRFDLSDLNDLPDYDDLIKSIQVIEQDNNHLYNEFEIPDEEKQDDNNVESNEELAQQESVEYTKEEVEQESVDNIVKLENVEENVVSENEAELQPNVSENEEELVIDISKEKQVVDEDGNNIFGDQFEEEIPDFLKDEKNLQKID